MSFNRLRYDTGAYEHRLYESVGPGVYQTAVPQPDCGGTCVSEDPRIRLQRPCDVGQIVDVASDLEGITRRATKCPTEQYLPGRDPPAPVCGANFGVPSKRGLGRHGISAKAGAPLFTQDAARCMPTEEDTRLSNPPCTLRGTGVNRFDPLCWNPQDRAVEPWRYRDGTSYRIVVKDNHRPCLPTQEDVDRACGIDAWTGLAGGGDDDGFPASSAPAPFTGGPSLPHLSWAPRGTVARL